MKHRVNLLTEAYRPKLELISFNLLIFAVCISLLLVVATYGFVQYQHSRVKSELANTKSQQALRDRQISTLSERLSQLTEDPKMLAQVQLLEEDIKQIRMLIRQLAGREAQKSRGFSELMLELANQHDSALWLTKIDLNEGKVSFEGQALDASAVPRWVGKLAATSYFERTEFASARLFRDEQDALNFSLSSELADPQAGTNE